MTRLSARGAAALTLAAFLALPPSVRAQGYFVPPAGGGGGEARPAARPSRPQPQARPMPMPDLAQGPEDGLGGGPGGPGAPEGPPPPLNVPLPAVPELPPLPKGAAPPAAVIGVIDVPSIMRAATAAQQIERTLGERRDRLNADVQKERLAWRDIEQSLQAQRGAQTPDQIRNKERELQERVTNAQKQWRERLRIMQEAQQYSLAQIERALIAIIRQVADSRGMNLVLHRGQVALNVNEFDITAVATDQVNKALPTVLIPPDGVSAVVFAQEQPKPPVTQAATVAVPGPASATSPAPPVAPGPRVTAPGK